ncbi:MAG: rRNA adenine dimethyltransferase family protein [Phycisphaerales bacterium]
MQTLAQIKAMLEAHGLSPRRHLGQNFLIDKNLVTKLADAALEGIPSESGGPLVLEVGPGTGTLTEALLERGCRVVSIELDAGLAALLRARAPEHAAMGGQLRLVEGDCLSRPGGRRESDAGGPDINAEALAALNELGGPDGTFVLAANLPYGAGTPFLAALLTRHHRRCRRVAVTVQLELADRLLARPRSRDYGPLSVLTQSLMDGRRLAELPPECFWPRPDVRSAMVVLSAREHPLTDDPARLGAFCRRLFTSRRKQLGAILGRDTLWPPGVAPASRPEEVEVENLIALMRASEGEERSNSESARGRPGKARLDS